MPLVDRSTIDSIWASSYAASMELDELPPPIRLRINTLGISQPTAWIHQPVPALGDSSIAEVFSERVEKPSSPTTSAALRGTTARRRLRKPTRRSMMRRAEVLRPQPAVPNFARPAGR